MYQATRMPNSMKLSTVKTNERVKKELKAAAILEKRRRANKEKTVYGIYKPNGQYGGELVKCLQEVDGEYIEVDSAL